MLLHLLSLLLAVLPTPQSRAEYLGSPIHYEAEARTDPLAQLAAAVEAGERELAWTPGQGWLPAVLEALEMPVESQVLVFSKTSFQDRLISPTRPRAIYFGEDAYLGWIPGAPVMEVTAIDPVQGPTFYVVPQKKDRFEIERRDTECLSCHAGSRTLYWPGNLVRSVHPDADGQPILRSGTHLTTHASPLAERWGGWYVTGTSGDQRHMGNAWIEEGQPERIDPARGSDVTDLSPYFDTERYPSAHSDIVALMVMEHQAEMHNVLARASYLGRKAQAYQEEMNKLWKQPEGTVSESTQRRYDKAARKVVDHLLFRGEVALTAPVVGTSGFAEAYAAAGKRDSKGRSLRDFDLETRLFKYPCSDAIYSEAFDALPGPVMKAVWKELGAVLSGEDVGRDFSHLSPSDRRAVLDVVRETRVELPEDWGA